MGLTNVGYLAWPSILLRDSPSTQSQTLDASGEKAAWIFQIPEQAAGTIAKIGIRTGTVTTGGTFTVRIESVNTSTDEPTGTLWDTNTEGNLVVDSADDNTVLFATLTAGAVVTHGDLIAIVLTAPASVNAVFITGFNANQCIGFARPYFMAFTGGVWAKNFSMGLLNVIVEYSGATYKPILGVLPVTATSYQSITNATTPDEIGNVMTLPFKCRAIGIWHLAGIFEQSTVKLYSSTDVLLGSGTVYLAGDYNTTFAAFDAPIELAAETLYRLTLLPSGASGIEQVYLTTHSAAIMDGVQAGSNIYFTQRTDAGAWSDVTTKRLMIGLVLDQIHDGAGGLITDPGMSGGFRG